MTVIADVLQPEIALGAKLTLAGVEYQLAFPIKAVIAYKQKTGESLYVIGNWSHIDPKDNPEFFLAALWAALQTHHPDMTYEKLSELVDFTNSVAIETAIVSTLKSYFPKPKPVEGSADPNAQTPESKSQASSTSGQ